MMTRIALLVWTGLLLIAEVAHGAGGLTFVCRADNDLYRAVTAGGTKYARFGEATKAVEAAPAGAGVLILADGYPKETTVVGKDVFTKAAAKRLRLLVEYPGALPGLKVGKPTSTHVQRVVINSDFFGSDLKKLRIVSVNGLHYVPLAAAKSHLVAAQVAGFDRAVYGLPAKTSPILFEMPGRNVMVATTCLSRFVTGRYSPQAAWRDIWSAVLKWLDGAKAPALHWTPTVQATYSRDEPLPADYELQAIRRGIEWYKKAKMIVHPSFEKNVPTTQRIASVPADTPTGDGSLGCLEAVISVIHQDGTQSISSVRRGDCVCESAMAHAFAGKVLKSKAHTDTARNLLDYWMFKSDARKKQRGDPKHGAYGLIAWGVTTPAWYKANYGDDNARVMLSTLAAAALNEDDRWDEAMMMCLLANLRTTGRFGFRGGRIDIGPLSRGWRRYFHAKPVNYAPHYESYLWACYLWAYEQTGYKMFLDRAETALKMTMAQHTDGWRWTNGLAQERARIILPLAWLVRVRNTPANRAMLRKAVDGLLALQDKCGAIREELGRPGKGAYPPPRSNKAYGTNEASLIARNGDPVTDLLYTTNFAFLGLHEAAAATGDKNIISAGDKLAEFLCRIQVKSKTQPAVDGGWFRAFDFDLWEHWGSNADHGWGAWCIESGWTQGWITSVLAMRRMKTSLWDLTHNSKIERHHERLREVMIPDEAIKPPEVRAATRAKKVRHAAVGKDVKLTALPSPSYRGLGSRSLADGRVSGPDHTTGLWLGFNGDDLEAVVDLGASQPIRQLSARFLQSISVGVHLPRKVVFEVSIDGKTFAQVASVSLKDIEKGRDKKVHTVTAPALKATGRFVRVRAENVKIIPRSHPASGRKAWLFVDEVLINPTPTKPRDEAIGKP